MANYHGMHPVDKQLQNMNYRDLKIACIVRGMEFNDVVEGYHGTLAAYFRQNYGDGGDVELLEEFDVWMDQQLAKNNIPADDPLRLFKLSSTLDPETDELLLKRRRIRKAGVKVPKKTKAKAERNKDFGVRKGTKKEYTMTVYKKLHDLGKNLDSKKLQAKLIDKVMAEFPEANEKSIKIWISQAKKKLNNG